MLIHFPKVNIAYNGKPILIYKPILKYFGIPTFGTWSILGDPGAVSGAGKSQNGREKIRAKKSQEGDKSPWGQDFNRPVPNGRSNSVF